MSFLLGVIVATVLLTIYHNTLVVALVQKQVALAVDAVKAKLLPNTSAVVNTANINHTA